VSKFSIFNFFNERCKIALNLIFNLFIGCIGSELQEQPVFFPLMIEASPLLYDRVEYFPLLKELLGLAVIFPKARLFYFLFNFLETVFFGIEFKDNPAN